MMMVCRSSRREEARFRLLRSLSLPMHTWRVSLFGIHIEDITSEDQTNPSEVDR